MNHRKHLAAAFALTFSMSSASGVAADRWTLHSFQKIQLHEQFFSEGATFGDLDGDGDQEIISGPYWYEGPDWQVRHEIYPPRPFDTGGYSDNFFAFVHDFNGDRKNDIFFIGFPGQDASWFENTGSAEGHWPRHKVFDGVDNESPTFQDLTGDGKPELICQSGDRLGYATPDWSAPEKPWTFHPVSEAGIGGRFTHGLGLHDIDGDGRTDLLMKNGWWQQPASLDGDPLWPKHPAEFAGRGGAQMYGGDLDGDGDADVISSSNAHGYGLDWFEQVEKDGAITFVRHPIMGDRPEQNDHGLVIGNLHAIDFIDMDGDGRRDIVTGARFWAHNGGDRADHDPARLYWFRSVLDRGTGEVRFEPNRIDEHSGVGTQVVAGDINGDGLPDVVVGNKMGTFVHLQSAREVSRNHWLDERRRIKTRIVSSNNERQRKRTGSSPRDDSGRTLNLGFESGDLTDWTPEGDAFDGMPVKGDTVHPRRPDSRSEHAGKFWLGGFEHHHTDRQQGALTSAAFPVTHPFASYLVGGGKRKGLRVELVLKASGEVIDVGRGRDRENMEVRYVDLTAHQGQEVFLRLVDQESGGWGHLNFDDFLFHEQDPAIRDKLAESEEREPGSGFEPVEAAARMTVPDGFHVDLVAGEPDLHQPIAFCMDEKGRLWVAEAHAYPFRREEGDGRDKIVVFEDGDGDGSFETRTVFIDDLNLISGLEVGFGGVWVGAAPEFQFIPDADGDLVPDGPPVTLLDGWGFQDTHETLNAFNWGPDGWLYGCHGVFTHSRVGKPGTPDEERVPLNAAVWRYHPTRHAFEIFAWGSSNPWGVDFDDHGQAVITACVIPHLFHVIQGARYRRQAGSHFNPYVYDDIKTIADHVHYLGDTPHSGNGVSGAVGGGHAHCGALVYLGDSFPAEYRGAVFMNNIHGNRVNVDRLKRRGSGFVGLHAEDFLMANDPWFRGINFRVGPDGSVFLIDWYDAQACHRRVDEIWDRSNGRMFRVRYGEVRGGRVDLAALSDLELVELQLHANDWHVRNARRLLQERGGSPEVHAALEKILRDNPDVTRRLRALWALHVTGGLDETLCLELMKSEQEHLRAWAIQLQLESGTPTASFVRRLAGLAKSDPSPLVRLYLAAAMQRLPHPARFDLADGLLSHAEDRDDHNLPLMIWYGLEPAVTSDPERAMQLSRASRIPVISRYIVRRLAAPEDGRFDDLVVELEGERKPAQVELILEQMNIALEKADSLPMPERWPEVSRHLLKQDSTRDRALSLALLFGDRTVMPILRERLVDSKAPAERRRDALENLVRFQDETLRKLLPPLLRDGAVQGAVLRAMASYEDPRTPKLILAAFERLGEAERVDAVNTLTSRSGYAREFLDAVIKGRVPKSLLDSATTRRQIALLEDEGVDRRMADAWGRSVATSADKKKEIERLKGLLNDGFVQGADRPHGRQLFQNLCAACHTLFSAGAAIGPDLTGSNRGDLEYILSNMVDPSGEVGKEYMMSTVTLKGGRVLAGMISDENAQTLTVRNDKEQAVVRLADVVREKGQPKIVRSQFSLMPEGLLAALSDEELRDLIGYLKSEQQVPLPATPDNAGSFFNGENLDGWIADPAVWRVEGGEIVGQTKTGLKQNDFARSDLLLGDFRLLLEIRLVGDQGNSGIQFRSAVHGEKSMQGYQADVGPGWWGKLYEEHGRALLWKDSGEQHVRKDEWNTYEILAVGSRIRTAINGQPCVDLDDPQGARQGVVGLQVHSGGPTEVRFRNLRLELDPAPELKTAP